MAGTQEMQIVYIARCDFFNARYAYKVFGCHKYLILTKIHCGLWAV